VSSRSGKSFSTPRSTSMGRGSSSSMNPGPISR
jgi:hypothetical protein